MKNKLIHLRMLLLISCLLGFVNICTGENVKKSIDDNRDDNGEVNDESKDESLDIPAETEAANITCARRANSDLHEIREAQTKQFPFIAAIMSHQNDFLCSGSVVSNGLILTTATCIQQPIAYVLLNTTRDKKDEHTAVLHVIKVEKFPTYTGPDSVKNIGLVYVEKHNSSVASKIRLSNFTNIKKLEIVEGVGFGLNADVNQPRLLQYVGLQVRTNVIYMDSETETVRTYFDCVETKVPTCFRDTGGPAIFDNELVGVITEAQEDCTKEISAVFAINKPMVLILPTYAFKSWLDEKIKKNEEENEAELPIYPLQPVLRRRTVHKMTASGQNKIEESVFILVIMSTIAKFT